MSLASTRLDASLLRPNDDVATALFDLDAGTKLRVEAGSAGHDVRLVERIATGHKFAVRDLAAGLRIRKYGECIGRLTADVPAGAWIHDHNLETSARRDPCHEQAWSHPVDAPVEVAAYTCTSVGENPLYDARTNTLYFIDVRDTPAIHALDLASREAKRWPLAEDIGSIALTSGRELLAGLRSGFAFFDPESGAFTPVHDPEAHLPRNRMNDGRCDPRGRFWCGSMNPDSGLAEGSLYVLDADLACRREHGGYLTPNGIAWTLDARTMYVADTRRGVIYAFAFDVERGTLGERRVFADLGSLPGGPDGATVDAEGFLWSAQFDGGCLIRYEPSGRMDRVVRVPVDKPTSCAFGGADCRTLFVTTATRGLDANARAAQPLAGRVLALDVGVAGLPPVRFAGTPPSRRTS